MKKINPNDKVNSVINIFIKDNESHEVYYIFAKMAISIGYKSLYDINRYVALMLRPMKSRVLNDYNYHKYVKFNNASSKY